MKRICITAKENPDLDGVACILGFADLLQKQGLDAHGCIFGIPQSEVQYFIEKHNLQIPAYNGNASWDNYILVDASSMKGMPNIVQANLVKEIIDHRDGAPEKEFPNAKIQNELVGAAATLIVERFIQANIMPNVISAKLLYGAIFHNSLNFISANTTKRDRLAIEFLEKNFDLSPQIIDEMFAYATKQILDNLEDAIINDAKQFDEFNFYQLIISNIDYKTLADRITPIIIKQDLKHPCQWSILNLVDITNKTSSLYVPSKLGQEKCIKLQCNFSNSWGIIPAALRKELIPKLKLKI